MTLYFYDCGCVREVPYRRAYHKRCPVHKTECKVMRIVAECKQCGGQAENKRRETTKVIRKPSVCDDCKRKNYLDNQKTRQAQVKNLKNEDKEKSSRSTVRKCHVPGCTNPVCYPNYWLCRRHYLGSVQSVVHAMPRTRVVDR